MAIELDKLVQQNLDLFESGNFADAEILCNGKTWKVHKLILRAACPWFKKAFDNDWKEAQTGQIHLDDEQPEQVNELLKFIYSGRYVPIVPPNDECITTAVLVKNVSMWRTADFFLLPDLKAVIHNYLILRLAAVLRFFHHFRFSLDSACSREAFYIKDVKNQGYLDTFVPDLSQAITKIYTTPSARELQKLFALFACGMREYLPAHVMAELLEKIPDFQQDLSTALIAFHFSKTNELVNDGLKSPYVLEAWKSQPSWVNGHYASFRCSTCGLQSPGVRESTYPTSEMWDITIDPFPMGKRKWCDKCATQSINSLLETMINEWPDGAPVSGWGR